jgi:7-keto-8-aminopelargonate synthetase-like enzyme
MADIFDKCVEYKDSIVNVISNYIRNDAIEWEDSIDIFEHFSHNWFNRPFPINNGGPHIYHDHREGLQFSTNDYLGLSRNKELQEYALQCFEKHGISMPMGSRALTGTTEIHLELEKLVAEFKKKEDAMTFSTGAGAMMGVVSGLTTKNDLVILDQKAHASLYCGAKISSATIRTFKHNDVADLEKILRQSDPNQATMIVIDGVYSMDGDIAPLSDICDLRDKFNVRLLVDDAHGNGVLGEGGRGCAELYGVEDRIDIHAGTFSKAFGLKGGFVAADKSVIEFLRLNAYTNLFTKAQPAVFAAVIIKALDIVKNATDLRQRVFENAAYLQKRLQILGFDIGKTMTPITPIYFPGLEAFFIVDTLRVNFGIFTVPVFYPAISWGSSLIRIIPTALHTEDHLNRLCNCLDTVYNDNLYKKMDGYRYENIACATTTA